MADLLERITASAEEYLQVDGKATADAQLEGLVYGRFLEPDARKQFFDDYKDIESLWEILSPSAELRDHIKTYKHLSQLYAAVRNAYSQTTSFLADLEHKTRRLVEVTAVQDGPGRFSKVVTFDVETLESLRNEEGPEEGKVYNLLRGLRKEMDDDPAAAVVLQGLMERSQRIIQSLEKRKITGLAAMDELAALAAEKSKAKKKAEESGLSDVGFAVYWVLEQDDAVVAAGVDPLAAAQEIEAILTKFPNWRENPDEKRQLRRNLYKPLLHIPTRERADVIERVMQILERAA
jgi:type I restriction enzyme R subunit